MSNVAEWLRERAERIEQSGDSFANVYGRALREAADDFDAAGGAAVPADAAP